MRESCVLCACKHIAQARVLLLESLKGYEEHYLFALGHLSEAEDELVKDHAELANYLRDFRKQLEEDPEYVYPFTDAILHVAHQGEAEVEAHISDIEAEFEGKTPEELRAWWTTIQR